MTEEKPATTTFTRREFFALSLIAASAGSPDAPGTPWYASMRRCGQINFNERDPLTLDTDAWMDYWASLKVDVMLLNGGGIVAFYPTGVPFHRRSQFLGARDLFGEAVAAAKKRNLRVVARMDCNLAWEDALRAHPEWFERNADRSPRTDGESPWLYRTCMFSPYFTDQMTAIYREINRSYAVDGFFTNGWPGTGDLAVCYCQNCQRVYRERVGGIPSEDADVTNSFYRRYYAVYLERIREIWKLWDSVAREKGPDLVYVGNLGGGIRAVKSLKDMSDVASWFNADHQGRSGDTPIWDCAQQGRVAQSVMKGRVITNAIGAYSNSQIIWRHSAKPAAELKLWLAEAVASGMVPWFHWLGGSPQDNRWREPGRSFYQWLGANEAHFRNRRSVADLAVLYPQRTIAFYRPRDGGARSRPGVKPGARGSDRYAAAEYLQGLYYALLEGRFVFDFVHQENLSIDVLRNYRALLMPNAAYLSAEECQAIRDYVAAGGSVLATLETSRYSEWGDPRPDFGLAEVFGASVSGDVIGPLHNSYMRIESSHPITRGFQGTDILPGAESRVPVRALDPAPPALTVVPRYPWYPPEMVYPRTPRTSEPAALFRQVGRSRIAYFPGDIDRSSWRSGSADLSQILQNAITWLLGDAGQFVTVAGQGLAELFVWETEPGYALHILNYTNPNMTRGLIRRFYPIGPQLVRFQVAEGRVISSVRALGTGQALAFEQVGRTVRFEVPRIVDYEVIALV